MYRRLLRVEEAAESLAISRAKLYQLMACGVIEYINIGRSRRIPVSALDAYIESLTAKESAA